MKITLLYVLTTVFFLLALSMDSILGMVFYLIISGGMFYWAKFERASLDASIQAEIQRQAELLLAEIPYTEYIVSSDYLTALLINANTNTLYIASRKYIDSHFIRKEYPFSKIMEAAIIQDGEIITLFPKDGLIGGSLINNNHSTEVYILESNEDLDSDEEDEVVSKLSLKMAMNDLANPVIEYVFMENEDSITKNSSEYQEVFKLCNAWYQKVSMLIKRAEYERLPTRS